MQLRVHNTLTRTKEVFEPQDPKRVRMYVCGPTVYNLIHVGNARPAIVFDVLVRHLRAAGRKVTFVRNYTDIDDRIIATAVANREEPMAVAERYIDAYLADTTALGCLAPDHQPPRNLSQVRFDSG